VVARDADAEALVQTITDQIMARASS
jgi:hypothetical protein